MALTDGQRAQTWAVMMEAALVPADVEKADFRAAVDALDAALDTVASTLNASLPTPYRTAATAAQKSALTGLVALRRAIADGVDLKAIGGLF
jgi:hypothetical protein